MSATKFIGKNDLNHLLTNIVKKICIFKESTFWGNFFRIWYFDNISVIKSRTNKSVSRYVGYVTVINNHTPRFVNRFIVWELFSKNGRILLKNRVSLDFNFFLNNELIERAKHPSVILPKSVSFQNIFISFSLWDIVFWSFRNSTL